MTSIDEPGGQWTLDGTPMSHRLPIPARADLLGPFPTLPRIRDMVIAQPLPRTESGAITYAKPGSPEALARQAERDREERERVAALAPWLDLFRAVQSRVEGTLRIVLDMHEPENRHYWNSDSGAPDCRHCTDENEYGERTPRWPCATVRVVAGDVGVDLPDRDEDD